MRAEHQALLDVAGARRAGDEIDRARHGTVDRSATQPVPPVLIGRPHLARRATRQYACRAENCCGSGFPAPESSISVPVSAIAGKAAGDAGGIAILGAALANFQSGVASTECRSSCGIRRHHQPRRKILARQIIGDGAGHLGSARNPRHRGIDLFGHGDEKRDLARVIERRPPAPARGCGDAPRAAPRARRASRDRAGPRPSRATDTAEDLIARSLGHARGAALPRSAQSVMKLSPSGAGISRISVQPEASGSERNRPRAPAEDAEHPASPRR